MLGTYYCELADRRMQRVVEPIGNLRFAASAAVDFPFNLGHSCIWAQLHGQMSGEAGPYRKLAICAAAYTQTICHKELCTVSQS